MQCMRNADFSNAYVQTEKVDTSHDAIWSSIALLLIDAIRSLQHMVKSTLFNNLDMKLLQWRTYGSKKWGHMVTAYTTVCALMGGTECIRHLTELLPRFRLNLKKCLTEKLAIRKWTAQWSTSYHRHCYCKKTEITRIHCFAGKSRTTKEYVTRRSS